MGTASRSLVAGAAATESKKQVAQHGTLCHIEDMTRLAVSALVCVALSPACTNRDNASTPTVPPPEAAEAPDAASAPTDNATALECGSFRFTVGELDVESDTPANDDNPVGESVGSAPLTLQFECDGQAQQLALGDLNMTCGGAFCGSGCVMHDETQSACDFDLQTDELTEGLAASVPEELFSWLVLTSVSRAAIHGYDVYRVQKTPSGFAVLRETYGSGGPAEGSQIVASYPPNG